MKPSSPPTVKHINTAKVFADKVNNLQRIAASAKEKRGKNLIYNACAGKSLLRFPNGGMQMALPNFRLL